MTALLLLFITAMTWKKILLTIIHDALNFRSFVALHALAFEIPACCPKRLRDLLGEFCRKYATSSNFPSVKTRFTFSCLSIKMPSVHTFFTKLKIVTFEGICTPGYLRQNFLLQSL